MASFKSLGDLINGFTKWFTQSIPQSRLTGDNNPRLWYTKAIDYTLDFTQANLQTVTDRSILNSDYNSRLQIKNVNQKQGGQSIKIELNELYSFQKCFVARHRTRIQYYRDDLSQKGYRNMYAVALSYDNFQLLQTNLKTQNT